LFQEIQRRKISDCSDQEKQILCSAQFLTEIQKLPISTRQVPPLKQEKVTAHQVFSQYSSVRGTLKKQLTNFLIWDMEKENRFLEDFIFGDDIFCSTIEDLVEYLERDGDIGDLPEDWESEVELTELKKVFEFDDDFVRSMLDWVVEANEEEFDSSEERVENQIRQAFLSGIDKEKINKALPELYYGTGERVTVTKKDLLCCK